MTVTEERREQGARPESERTQELRERLLGYRPTDRLWGWLAPGIIAVVGGFFRFWNLGNPRTLSFDEVYYVPQAYLLMTYGVEYRVKEGLKTGEQWNARTIDIWNTTDGDMVVHPSVGKWVISFGEWIFGPQSAFGWRFSVALLGTLMILMVGRIARRMFGSTALGCIAAFLLAFEGLHLVLSRTGILDLVLAFFALAAFGALLVDRDRTREILARKVAALPRSEWPTYGPWLGWRPWRWVAGLSLALCTSTKWSGIFFVAAFGLMTVWWDMGARRAAGVRSWLQGTLALDGAFAFVQLVVVTAVGYVVSWAGWFVSDHGYKRHWVEAHPEERISWLPNALTNLWLYHKDVWAFSYNLSSPHDYQSNAWSWLVMARPVSFFYESPKQGQDGCEVEQCSKAITTIGNVGVWWVGIAALAVLLFWWLMRRDWRAGAVWAGMAGSWLPWFLYQHRTIFIFYAVAIIPFVVLAVTMLCGIILGGPELTRRQRRPRIWIVGGYLLVVLALFAFFHPIWTATVIPQPEWHWRMWFPSWV